MDYVIQLGDQIIAISEDDDTIIMNGKLDINTSPTIEALSLPAVQKVTNTLILGWNNRGQKILRELNDYVAEGSKLLIVAELSEVDIENITSIQSNLNHIEISYQNGEISDKKTLEKLNKDTYNNIIVLSYSHLSIQESDAKTLICLLHLRNISEHLNRDFNIVTEMLDLNNRELGVVAKADDFIVGNNLISLLLAQISENPDLIKVYNELFKAEGSEIYLKPASRYIAVNTDVDFYTIVANAAAIQESAIGYRISALNDDLEHNFGIKLNPKKDETIRLSANDFVIVLSED
jgi:hypothetical protein